MIVLPYNKSSLPIALSFLFFLCQCTRPEEAFKLDTTSREQLNLNEGWYFMKYTDNPDSLLYDIRPDIVDLNAFNGWVLAIVKAKKGAPGKITLRATAEGLEDTVIDITTIK